MNTCICGEPIPEHRFMCDPCGWHALNGVLMVNQASETGNAILAAVGTICEEYRDA